MNSEDFKLLREKLVKIDKKNKREIKLPSGLLESFDKFKRNIKEEEFSKRIIYYFELSLENIKQNHQEVAFLLLCVIIESLAYKKYNITHNEFCDWLKMKENFLKFSKEFCESKNKKVILEQWKKQYQKDYSITQKFVDIIITCYKKQEKIPSYIFHYQTTKHNGIKTSTSRPVNEPVNPDKLYLDFEKDLKIIYGTYRSKFVHEGKFLPFDSKITSMCGGISCPQSISSQQFAGIVFFVMDDFFISLKKE